MSKSNQTTIPGLFLDSPNHHVDALKAAPWPAVLALLGRSGESVMIDLLLDCAIFAPVESGYGNYAQMSGESSSDHSPK